MGNVTVSSNADEVMHKLRTQLKKAVRVIGGTAESHAKEYCPVDTGLLRNSIISVVAGESPQVVMYRNNPVSAGGQRNDTVIGTYSGQAPAETDPDVATVYVGTNVHYAPYQELGAPSINLPAQPYLRPAFENHKSEYEQILRLYLRI